MQFTSMSILKIHKEISKLLNEEARIIHPDTQDIYIISHSKGKHLKTVIPGRLRVRIHIYNQSGADISSDIG